MEQWNTALATAWRLRDEYIAQSEPAVLEIAAQIARKLLGEESIIAPERVAAIAREALRSVRRAKSFVIQVHPTDVSLVRQRVEELRTIVGQTREIEVISSPFSAGRLRGGNGYRDSGRTHRDAA